MNVKPERITKLISPSYGLLSKASDICTEALAKDASILINNFSLKYCMHFIKVVRFVFQR